MAVPFGAATSPIGAGRVTTDEACRYRFVSVKPGAYPWKNHDNAWRPAHIHLSLMGPAFATRLITQMYFEGDPLIGIDPIACAVPESTTLRRAASDSTTASPCAAANAATFCRSSADAP